MEDIKTLASNYIKSGVYYNALLKLTPIDMMNVHQLIKYRNDLIDEQKEVTIKSKKIAKLINIFLNETKDTKEFIIEKKLLKQVAQIDDEITNTIKDLLLKVDIRHNKLAGEFVKDIFLQ